MPDPATLRDSTQIVLPCELLDGLRDDLDEEFTVTIVSSESECRIIGSPVEIKEASDYLVRHGVSVS
jgi:hypothetical protein